MRHLETCLLTGYQFNVCFTQSCKYFTPRRGSHCIHTMCSDTDIMTIEEIAYFKNMSVEKAEQVRLLAEKQVKHLLVLERWFHETENYVDPPEHLTDIILDWYDKWPMTTDLWPQGKRMLKHVTDMDKWRAFKDKFKLEYEAHELIGMDQEDFEYCSSVLN